MMLGFFVACGFWYWIFQGYLEPIELKFSDFVCWTVLMNQKSNIMLKGDQWSLLNDGHQPSRTHFIWISHKSSTWKGDFGLLFFVFYCQRKWSWLAFWSGWSTAGRIEPNCNFNGKISCSSIDRRWWRLLRSNARGHSLKVVGQLEISSKLPSQSFPWANTVEILVRLSDKNLNLSTWKNSLRGIIFKIPQRCYYCG